MFASFFACEDVSVSGVTWRCCGIETDYVGLRDSLLVVWPEI